MERWLKAPIRQKDGQLDKRDKGTPQGGVISPLLANLYMHYTFDMWMEKHFPYVRFERFADDILAHCQSLRQADEVLEAIKGRLKECCLELNTDKTQIVYCKDVDRKGSHEHESFDFLGYTFRPRLSKNK